MKLYGYWRSSSSWRVRIALAYKNIAYENIPVHLLQDGGQQHAPGHASRNPMEQVPVLEIQAGGATHHLSQSLAILEYLEERFPSPRLLPRDHVDRAHARQLAELVNSGIQPLQNITVLQRLKNEHKIDEAAWARHFMQRGLAALERSAAGTAGRFLVGDEPSFADVCLVPQLYNARRYGVALDAFPLLLRVESACNELPAFDAAHPDRQPDAVPATTR
jgi:maleylpyruvate isomerase